MMEVGRLQTLKNVMRLMEYDLKCVEQTVEETGTGDKERLPDSYPGFRVTWLPDGYTR